MSVNDLLNVKGYAHRGLHNSALGIIENSKSAFQAAIDAKMGIELDVQMSVERTPMVFHDEILSRLAGRDGRLAFMKAKELAEIPYTNSQDKIMTLADCLELVNGQVPMLIEVKSHWHGKPQMENELAKLLGRYDGPYGVMSFDPDVIERLQQTGAKGPFGLVTGRCPPKDWQGLSEHQRRAGQVQFEKARALNIEFIAHQVGDLNNPLLASLVNDLQLKLFSWTIDHLEKLKIALSSKAIPIFEGESGPNDLAAND